MSKQESMAERYGEDIAQFFVEADKKDKERKTAEKGAAQNAEWEAERLKQLSKDSRQLMYDAMRPVLVDLKVRYEMGNSPGFENYTKLAYDICCTHLENFFYPKKKDEGFNIDKVIREEEEKQRREYKERYSNYL